jgi:4-hydroxybenzoate polyprenyltransferase
MAANEARAQTVRRKATAANYIAIMRFDHATKHVFVIPGVIVALLLRGSQVSLTWWPFVAGALVAVLIASADYVINEWLDREFDAHHPTKSGRTAVQIQMDGSIVWTQWGVLGAIGLLLAASASRTMFFVAAAFAVQGIIYNVKPFRSKDYPYVDVLTESINNPLRLLIGWATVDPATLPPSSLLVAYWLGGAFLMGAKRLSEYREIVAAQGRACLIRYRASFAWYDEFNLTASCLVYALLSAMTLAIFFVKYRIEYILTLPAIALLFGEYMALALRPASTAQRPERLFREKSLLGIALVVVLLFAICTVVNIPILEPLTGQIYIKLR